MPRKRSKERGAGQAGGFVDRTKEGFTRCSALKALLSWLEHLLDTQEVGGSSSPSPANVSWQNRGDPVW